jgi:hypothetical protein
MQLDTKTLLTARFIAAIRKAYTPTPLIGEGWFRFYPSGKPAHFQMLLGRISKALGEPPAKVGQTIIGALDLKGVAADVRLTSKHDAINVRLREAPQPAKA